MLDQLIKSLAPGALILLGSVPVFGLLFFINLWSRNANRDAKSPITEDLVRSPGQSAQEKADELRGQALEQVIWLVAPPMVFPVLVAGFDFRGVCIALLGICIYVAVIGRGMRRNLKAASDFTLGAKGERAVAQAIDAFKAQGGEVFHDLQMDGYNIDHVVVTESAVLCIETKTRRKPVKTKAPAKLIYRDGFVCFPWGRENYGVEQARRQAVQLGELLSKECRKKVHAFPVLTFPGWWVEEVTREDDLLVCNPKQIVATIKKDFAGMPVLEPAHRAKIIECLRGRAVIPAGV